MSQMHAKALHRAAEILGGVPKLREYLGVPASLLDIWMTGVTRPPVDVFLRTVDVISGTPAGAPPRRARERAMAVRASILSGKQNGRRNGAPFLQSVFDAAQGREMVESALDAALTAADTGLGNVQLACAEGLRIVAQRGFRQPFLDFFSVVAHNGSACGVAAKEGRQIVVPDVAGDPIFTGTTAGEIVLRASVRAVQSTPLLSQSGELLGVLSTHSEEPGQPDPLKLTAIQRIAQRAAFWLEGGLVPS
jgi:hypothetical protein